MELMDIEGGIFSFVDVDDFAVAFSSAAFFAFLLSLLFSELFVEPSSVFLPLLSFSFPLFLVSAFAFPLLQPSFSVAFL